MDNVTLFNELSEHAMLRIYGSQEITHPGHWIESKNHLDYDLWYIQKGKVEIHINEEVYEASVGDLVLFSPMVAYTATTVDGPCQFIFTHFDFILGDRLDFLNHFQLSGVIKHRLVKEEVELFLDTYNQYKQNAPMSGIRLKGCLTILIAKIIEKYGTGQYRGTFTNLAPSHNQTGHLDHLKLVFDYVNEHLHTPLRIKDLATLAGMSEKYFIHYFKQALGMTPGRYVYQLKMNRARELLFSKHYTIQQIASKLGYPDPYSFSKAFKKHYKVPPSQFFR
ncbi:AraC family transcriptional regulator [Halalkalibacter sp. APA_J-10(15)]|uniref:helix-turn-helix transcriptional regulator n=1 Tax=Halalkalibacter sp. APA_J-10(15) TaxID=2933805 RepID=UPI001FF632CC|nr:AraC family transcriptional regulator [Halalkalibacter sp. APA_J-10(15)]MCK0473210.1 AraC family transcriptional regulator [Halalkalibacter sp. APA_J-10(15)]